MRELENWPYKWFGFWKEYGEDYNNFPTITSFINNEINSNYQKVALLNYLKNGHIVASTSRSAFQNPFTSIIESGEISIRTDGKWIWLDNICEFIEHNDLVLPSNFYEDIKKNNFIISKNDLFNLDHLECPNI
ncbi:hypothetical protein [Chryseobacterium sp. JUb7]|uniref:hypothetical protein n=1 Tax=Chryseobacterium sp. JUb7 TaxID=2940599 RepID=UPI00216A68BE|nr:hypothetical protein [Chryseobacterium sp. JUb7]MCS3533036.1 hypothetical protein [Chryseobacterium sp. JUb7]